MIYTHRNNQKIKIYLLWCERTDETKLYLICCGRPKCYAKLFISIKVPIKSKKVDLIFLYRKCLGSILNKFSIKEIQTQSTVFCIMWNVTVSADCVTYGQTSSMQAKTNMRRPMLMCEKMSAYCARLSVDWHQSPDMWHIMQLAQ